MLKIKYFFIKRVSFPSLGLGLLFLFLWPGAQNTLEAKETDFYIKFGQYMTEERQTYLEIFFTLESSSLDWESHPDGGFRGGMEATLKVRSLPDSQIVGGSRFRILSPQYQDTTQVRGNLIHQERLFLDTGKYVLEIELEDIAEAEETYRYSPALEINLDPEKPHIAEPLFLENYRKAESTSGIVRSGYELTPIITGRNYFYPESRDTLAFYSELYNMEQGLDSGSRFVIKYYLQEEASDQVLSKYGGYSMRDGGVVNPVLGALDISDLPTGNYFLVLEGLGPKGKSLIRSKTFFYRENQAADSNQLEQNYRDVSLSSTFEQELRDPDSLYHYIRFLHPISTDRQRDFQKGLVQDGDREKMKQYLFSFWQSKAPEEPAQAWARYLEKINYVNEEFKSSLRPGYLSARGRVYLTYGKPSEVSERTMEPRMPPYEIWHYKSIRSPYAVTQNNRIFVFAERSTSTSEYQLLHSTAVGEMHSRDWRQQLFQRAYGGNGNIDPSNSNDREFGNRANQNMLINSTGTDRRYR